MDNATAREKYQMICSNVRKVTRSDGTPPHFILFQEAHLNVHAKPDALSAFDSYVPFISGHGRNSAGVVTLVHKLLTQYYSFSAHHIQQGYLLQVVATPKPGWEHLEGFSVVNVYLFTGDPKSTTAHSPSWSEFMQAAGTSGNTGWRRRAYQVNLLNEASRPYWRNFFGGDFNFVEDEGDRSGQYSPPPAHFRQHWDRFIETYSLSECRQPTHTWFVDRASGLASARLDRFYYTTSEADSILHQALAYIPQIPYDIVSTYSNRCIITALASGNIRLPQRVHRRYLERNLHPTDHLPLVMDFPVPRIPGTEVRETRPPPTWVYDHPLFPKLFAERWSKVQPRRDPFRQLEVFQDCLAQTGFQILKISKPKGPTALTRISVLIQLLKLATGVHYDMATLQPRLEEWPFLCTLSLTGTSADYPILQAQVNTLIDNNIRAPSFDTEEIEGTPPRRPRAYNKLESLGRSLPSSRKKLTAVRLDADSPLHKDPDKVTAICASYWSKIWTQQAPPPTAADYLQRYGKRVEGIIAIPGAKSIAKVIRRTNNSAPGPDGIPFRAWKAVGELASLVLAKVLQALAQGIQPPKGFNHGLLFLIPKDGTLEVTDYRPISVPNSVNRIISATIYQAIVPACQAIVSARQTAMPGRQIGDNVRRFNELFYRAKQRKRTAYLLFVDFSKAFDNVSHHYLLRHLRHIGMPEWVLHCVAGLLTDLGVFTTIPDAQSVFIRVYRGTKQGCPLSPLLFVLLIDPLLCGLNALEVDARGYVDDAGAFFYDLGLLNTIMREARDFAEASGLSINLKKTFLISTKAFPANIGETLPMDKHSRPQCVQSAKYLGVLFGRSVTVADIFKQAMKKFVQRARSYTRARATLSVPDRILVANVFLLPIFSYLSQWFLIPHKMVVAINGTLHRFVVPFNSVRVQILTGPLKWSGVKPALKDPSYLNYSLLWKSYSPQLLHHLGPRFRAASLWRFGRDGKRLGANPHAPFDASSPRILHQAVYNYCFTKMYDIDAVPGDPSAVVYKALLHSDYTARHARHDLAVKLQYFQKRPVNEPTTDDSDDESELGVSEPPATKVHHSDGKQLNETFPGDCYIPTSWGGDELYQASDNCAANLDKLPGRTTSAVVWVQGRLMWHGLPLAWRLRHLWTAGNENGKNPHLSPDQCCPFCMEGSDSFRHVYLTCPVTRLAYQELWRQLFDTPPPPRDIAHLLLLIPLRKKVTSFLVNFHAALWFARMEIFNFGPPANMVRKITFLFRCNHLGASTALPWSRYKKVSPTGPHMDKRTKHAAAAAQVNQTLQSLPPDAMVAFTDGSALGNPGPGGAGVLFMHQKAEYGFSFPTGKKSTNQIGEVFALGSVKALVRLGHLEGILRPGTVHVFSDSLYAINTHEGVWKPKSNTKLINKVKRYPMPLGYALKLYWCPGHVDVAGNELADALAKQGAAMSKRANFTNHTDIPFYYAVSSFGSGKELNVSSTPDVEGS